MNEVAVPAAAPPTIAADNEKNIGEVFDFLDEKFISDYDQIELPSNLPDGTYTVVVTKSEVLPVDRNGGKTVSLKFSAKVLTPPEMAGKIFQYDFTLNENNKTMMKKMFFALGFEYDLRNQFTAFARLVGSELEINVSTNAQYKNNNIRRIVQKGELLNAFLANISLSPQL